MKDINLKIIIKNLYIFFNITKNNQIYKKLTFINKIYN